MRKGEQPKAGRETTIVEHWPMEKCKFSETCVTHGI
jgi:hypothetical protein